MCDTRLCAPTNTHTHTHTHTTHTHTHTCTHAHECAHLHTLVHTLAHTIWEAGRKKLSAQSHVRAVFEVGWFLTDQHNLKADNNFRILGFWICAWLRGMFVSEVPQSSHGHERFFFCVSRYAPGLIFINR